MNLLSYYQLDSVTEKNQNPTFIKIPYSYAPTYYLGTSYKPSIIQQPLP